jgi:hypothetical protein
LLHLPSFSVFQPLEEEILERVKGRLAGKAIINDLIIRVRFGLEFVRVRKEQQAEEQEDDDKSEGRLGHIFFSTKGHEVTLKEKFQNLCAPW